MPYLKPKCFTYSETRPGQKCIQDLILTGRLFDDICHNVLSEGWLFLILDDRQIYELVVPLAWKQLFAKAIDG